MSRAVKSGVHHPSRVIYSQIPLKCPICKKMGKQGKKLSSPYALLYHLRTYHNIEDELITGIYCDEVIRWVKLIGEAIDFGVLWT
jgi:hypothetical protein